MSSLPKADTTVYIAYAYFFTYYSFIFIKTQLKSIYGEIRKHLKIRQFCLNVMFVCKSVSSISYVLYYTVCKALKTYVQYKRSDNIFVYS